MRHLGPVHQLPLVLALAAVAWALYLLPTAADEIPLRPEVLFFGATGSDPRTDLLGVSTSVIAIYGVEPAQITIRLLMQNGDGPAVTLETYARSGPVVTPLREPIELVAASTRQRPEVVTKEIPVSFPSTPKRTQQVLVLRDGEATKPLGQLTLLIEPTPPGNRLATAAKGLQSAALWGNDRGLSAFASAAGIESIATTEDSSVQGIPWASDVTASLRLDFGERAVIVAVAPASPAPLVLRSRDKTVVLVPSTASLGTDPRYEDLLIEELQPETTP